MPPLREPTKLPDLLKSMRDLTVCVIVPFLVWLNQPHMGALCEEIPRASCDAGTVYAGQKASVTCRFPTDVGAEKGDVFVQWQPAYASKDAPRKEALSCGWLDKNPNCVVKKGFVFNGIITRSLRLVIPNVDKDYAGTYFCFLASLPGTPPEECKLIVIEHIPTTATTATTTNGSISPSRVSGLSFDADSRTTPDGTVNKATLSFRILDSKLCSNVETLVQSVKVFTTTKTRGATPLCHTRFVGGSPVLVTGCSQSDVKPWSFSVTRRLNRVDDALWYLIGNTDNGETFSQTLWIEDPSSNQYLSTKTPYWSTTRKQTTTRSSSPRDEITSEPEPSSDTTTPDLPANNQFVFTLLGGGLGFVLLAVLVLFVCVGVLFWKRGRPTAATAAAFLPSPAPHNVRRGAVPDAVVFHAQPAEQNGSDSSASASVQSHVYAEIPDDSDFTSTNNSLTTFSSSSVSDSSLSDECLHHIACPSSDSSLPEDYLHPADSSKKVGTDAKSLASDSSSSSEAVMYGAPQTFSKVNRRY